MTSETPVKSILADHNKIIRRKEFNIVTIADNIRIRY